MESINYRAEPVLASTRYIENADWGWAKEEIETAISEGRGYDVEPRFFRPDGTIAQSRAVALVRLARATLTCFRGIYQYLEV